MSVGIKCSFGDTVNHFDRSRSKVTVNVENIFFLLMFDVFK